jgi:NACalpha-BTF3-like transcription factor
VTESQKLEDLEAGLGKSTEGNIRIIKNLLRQNEQFYKQGRTAAFESDDLSTYESMQEAYGLTYGPSGDGDGAGATVENGTGEDDITEEDIQLTMKKRNMTREDVVKMLQEQGRIK